MSEFPPESKPKPVTRREFVSKTVTGLPERFSQLFSNIDRERLYKVLELIRPKILPSGEISQDFLTGFENWKNLAKEGRERGGIEFFANLILKDEKILPDNNGIREG